MPRIDADLDVFVDRDGRRYTVDPSLPPGVIYSVSRVETLRGYRLWVEFEDGTQGEADVSDLAEESHRVGDLWANREYFNTAHVPDYGGVAWKGQLVDINPNVLYMKVTGKALDEVYPQVRFLD